MILAYSHPQYLPLIEEKKTNDELSSIYESLVEGKYAIYFVFDRDFSLISYLAKAKDEATRPLLITMEINIAGNINKQKNREEDQNAVKALYLYVSEEEMRLKREDPSSFKERYSICYDELEETLSLSPEQLRLRNKVREEFTYLEFENEAGFAGENLKGPFSISLNIAIDHNNGSFLAYVGLCRDGKLVNGASDEVLFRAILGREKIKLPRKEGVGYLIKEEFLPGHYEALERLSAIHFAKSTTYGYAQTTKLSFGDLFEILTYLRGNNIVFDEMPVFIEETIIRADVSLLPDGSLAYIPSLKEVKSKNGKILQKGRNMLSINIYNGEIQLYQFPDGNKATLYSFFLQNGESSAKYLKDMLKEKVMPFLQINNPQDNYGISLYITINGNGNLEFKSQYSLDGVILPIEELEENLYFGALRSHYLKLLKSVGGIENGELDNGQASLKFLKADLSELKKTADIYRSDELNDIVYSVSNDIGVSLLGENGLINLEIVSEKYTKDELKEILKSFRKKKRFHLLHGKAIYLDAGLEAIDKTMNEGKVDLDSLESSRLPFYSAFTFLENKKVKISLNEYLTTAFENIKNFKNREVEIPDFLLDKLKPYQIDGVKYLLTLHDYHLGGVLADDMGLGKTLETIAFLSIAEIHKPLLVVCPKSLLYNWEAEVNMWNPFLPVYLIDGAKITRENTIKSINQGNKAIYVTSYNSLRNDTDLYEGIEFEAVILDEAQYIKNAGTKNSSSVKEIKAKTHFALTGTPLENSEMDLWSIFDFLLPGYLSSRQDFKDKYLLNPLGHNSLRKKLTPFILRRRKQDVLKELPPKITEVTTISLNDDERRYYDASLQEAKELLKSNSDSFTILPLLTKLREIAVDLPSFFEGDFEESSKLTYVVDRIEEAIDTGHKILVFSSFKRVLTHLQSLLNETNIPSYFINGDTPAQERLNICDRFNAEESVKVTLVSLKAGGTGLNLHGADIVIHLDPWWNEAAENQATDRAYRIGQKRTVNVYKLIAHDTIEEKVLLLQEKKHSLYESLISNTDEALTKLTREDIVFLLS